MQPPVQRQPETPAIAPPPSAAVDAAQHLEQTLTHFESMLNALEERAHGPAPRENGADAAALNLTELKQAMNDVFQQFEGALERLGVQAQRLSDGASDVALVAGRLEARMNEMSRSLSRRIREAEPVARPRQETPAVAPTPLEPQFQPGREAVGVVLAAVPGFQGLMDAQRTLSSLPETEGASVVAYKNGEASLEVVLREPVSVRQIVEGLQKSTGQQLLIEESRPEAQRLRLRFVEHEA